MQQNNHDPNHRVRYWGRQLLVWLINERRGDPAEIVAAARAGVDIEHLFFEDHATLWRNLLKDALEGRPCDLSSLFDRYGNSKDPEKRAILREAVRLPPLTGWESDGERLDVEGPICVETIAGKLLSVSQERLARLALEQAKGELAEGSGAALGAALSAVELLSDPSGWGPAQPLEEDSRLPRADLDSLPAWLGGYCRAVADAIQVAAEIPLVAGLALASQGLSGAAWIAGPQGQIEPPLLWAAVVAGSGERKSPAFARMLAPLFAAKARNIEEHRVVAAAESVEIDVLEGRIAALKKAAIDSKSQQERDRALSEARQLAETLARRPRPRLELLAVGDDATPEALAEQLIAQGRLAQVSAEGGGVLAIAGGRYSDGAALEPWLLGYGSDPMLSRSRAGQETSSVPWARLTVGIAVQPDAASRAARDPVLLDRGMIGRFLWLRPPSLVGYRWISDTPVENITIPGTSSYLRAGAAILATPQHPQFLDRGKEGAELPILYFAREGAYRLLDLARSVEARLVPGGSLTEIMGWANKMVGQAIRLAGILCLSERRARGIEGASLLAPVELDYVEAAIALVEISAAHTRDVCLSAPESLVGARRALSWIERFARNGVFKLTDLHAGIRLRGWEVDRDTGPIVAILARNNLIRYVDVPARGRGRPAVWYEAHPSIWGPKA